MSSIDLRYIINETPFNAFGVFTIMDQKEERVVCSCHVRKDAGTIAGLLNAEEIKRDLAVDEDRVVR